MGPSGFERARSNCTEKLESLKGRDAHVDAICDYLILDGGRRCLLCFSRPLFSRRSHGRRDHMDADDTEVQRYCSLLLKDESGVLRARFRFFPSANNEYQRKALSKNTAILASLVDGVRDGGHLALPSEVDNMPPFEDPCKASGKETRLVPRQFHLRKKSPSLRRGI